MYRKREYCLVGERVVLVPYSPHHVRKYHQWMQDPLLRLQTASEPLTLEEEYEMQETWLSDDDKCTFIVLSKELCSQQDTSEVACMAGDVNLFFKDSDNHSVAEIEVMIAEASCRKRGLGLEASQLMMTYGITELGVDKFCAKIRFDNVPSLQLFQEKLGFTEVSRNLVFQEVTMELSVTPQLASHYTTVGSDRWKRYSSKKILK